MSKAAVVIGVCIAIILLEHIGDKNQISWLRITNLFWWIESTVAPWLNSIGVNLMRVVSALGMMELLSGMLWSGYTIAGSIVSFVAMFMLEIMSGAYTFAMQSDLEWYHWSSAVAALCMTCLVLAYLTRTYTASSHQPFVGGGDQFGWPADICIAYVRSIVDIIQDMLTLPVSPRANAILVVYVAFNSMSYATLWRVMRDLEARRLFNTLSMISTLVSLIVPHLVGTKNMVTMLEYNRFCVLYASDILIQVVIGLTLPPIATPLRFVLSTALTTALMVMTMILNVIVYPTHRSGTVVRRIGGHDRDQLRGANGKTATNGKTVNAPKDCS